MRRINALGDQGFRLEGYFPEKHGVLKSGWISPSGGGIAILERMPNAPEHFHYLQFASGGRDRLEAFLNHVGTEGFDLLPRDVTPSWCRQGGAIVVWLEKRPDPAPRYSYKVIDWGMQRALKATFNPRFWLSVNPLDYIQSELKTANDQGYRLVRAMPFGVVILQKTEIFPGVARPSAASAMPASLLRYRSLGQQSATDLQRDLKRQAAEGYHIADLVPDPHHPWPAVLLETDEARPTTPSDGYEYRVIEEGNLDALNSKMKESASAGFHLLPQSMSRFNSQPSGQQKKYRAVLEKPPGTSEPYEYRFVAGTDVFAFREAIARTAAEGFFVVGLIDSLLVIMGRSVPPTVTGDHP